MKKKRNTILLFIMAAALVFIPPKASAEVAPITEVEDKLENITAEEMKVLQQLFTLSQEITDLEKQEDKMNTDIDQLEAQITDLDQDINGSLGLRYYFNDNVRLSWSSELDWQDGEFHVEGAEQSLKESEVRHLISLGASF